MNLNAETGQSSKAVGGSLNFLWDGLHLPLILLKDGILRMKEGKTLRVFTKSILLEGPYLNFKILLGSVGGIDSIKHIL